MLLAKPNHPAFYQVIIRHSIAIILSLLLLMFKFAHLKIIKFFQERCSACSFTMKCVFVAFDNIQKCEIFSFPQFKEKIFIVRSTKHEDLEIKTNTVTMRHQHTAWHNWKLRMWLRSYTMVNAWERADVLNQAALQCIILVQNAEEQKLYMYLYLFHTPKTI